MFVDTKRTRTVFILTSCVVCVSLVPKILMYSNNVIDPFTNSIVALAIETQASGHVPSNPYTLPGYWQTHANFLSFRTGIVSFLTIMSSITGLSPYIVASLPLTGVMSVIVGYLFGRAFGTRFNGLAFAVIFGYSWFTTLTATNIGYQSHGSLLQLIIFFILVRCSVSRKKWSRKDILIVCIMFLAIYQSYYTAEFTTLALFTMIAFFSLIHKALLKFHVKSLNTVPFLALWFGVIFIAFDTVAYSYLPRSSPALFESSILHYFSYVRSVIYGESEVIQEYRPYTNPISKYIDLAWNILTWSIIVVSLGLYLNTVRKANAKKKPTERKSIIHVILFSFLFVFFARLLIYGLLGKIAIGWIYISLMPIILAQIWFVSRSRARLKYILPIVLVGLTVFRFSIIWTDQTLSFIGANYPPLVSPSAHWIAKNLYSGSIVSSNQISAQVFSTVAEFGKANSISVNQFGSDANNLTDEASHLHRLLRSRGYDYMLLLKLFESQPVFGGFWGPYIPPLGNKLEDFNNCTCFSRIYDDGMSILYGLNQTLRN